MLKSSPSEKPRSVSGCLQGSNNYLVEKEWWVGCGIVGSGVVGFGLAVTDGPGGHWYGRLRSGEAVQEGKGMERIGWHCNCRVWYLLVWQQGRGFPSYGGDGIGSVW